MAHLPFTLIKSNRSWLAAKVRSGFYRTPCTIDTDVFITDYRNFAAGAGSCLYHASYILNDNGQFTIGRHSHLGAFCYVNVSHGRVIIGDDVAIGPGTKLIAYSNHYATGRKVTQERITGDISIGSNVFIGANCTLLPGTIIENNVVVGAGSVVKATLEGNAIYAGAPCRKIKSGWFEELVDSSN